MRAPRKSVYYLNIFFNLHAEHVGRLHQIKCADGYGGGAENSSIYSDCVSGECWGAGGEIAWLPVMVRTQTSPNSCPSYCMEIRFTKRTN